MRRAALFSCLSASAKAGRIVGLENYGTDHKTKVFVDLLVKLPVSPGRKIVFVLPKHMEALERGSRNVPGVKTILAQYLNPEDVLGAHSLVFLVEALKVAEDIFTKRLVVSDKPSDSKKKLPAKRSSLAASKTSKISSPDSAS